MSFFKLNITGWHMPGVFGSVQWLKHRAWIAIVVCALAVMPTVTGEARAAALHRGPAQPQEFFPNVERRKDAIYHTSEKSQAPVQLAKGKTALLPVVIAPNASEKIKALAEELAAYLQQISGAPFKVQTGDGQSGIVLGELKDFASPRIASPEVKAALAMHGAYEGREAFAIRTGPQRVLLVGATELGASHAQSRFLEILGCRWFFPAKEWEVVPSTPDLKFAHNETDRPIVLARDMFYTYGFVPSPSELGPGGKPGEQWRSARDFHGWKRRNRMAMSFTIYAAHAYNNVVYQNLAEFKKHPEYFGLWKGKRVSYQMCLSNAAVRRMVVEYALNYFKKRPEADMVSMEPCDGPFFCECDECKKLGSITDRTFGMANEAARALQAEFPGKMVGLYAYNEHADPPTFNLEPNVHVGLCNGLGAGQYSFDEQLEMWPKKTRNLGYYEYYSMWGWGQDRIRPPASSGPAASIRGIQSQIARYIDHDMLSFVAESSNSWGQYGRGYYITSKLLWNPGSDVQALLADFYDEAFGPAAPAVKRYYERLDTGNKPLFSKNLLALAYRDLEEASRLAAGRPDVQARLDHLKQYMHFNKLQWQLADAAATKDVALKKDLTLAVLTQSYRTRYSYMTHAGAMMSASAAAAAKEFSEPTWAFKYNVQSPWLVETPYSHEETEREFQEGLKFFQPEQLEEQRTYSDQLVPVIFPENALPLSNPKESTAYTYYMYGTKSTFALHAGKPGKLGCAIITAAVPDGTLRPGVLYVLKDPEGQELARGRLTHGDAKVRHDLGLSVRAPGLYHLEVDGVAWFFESAAGQPAAVVLQPDRNIDFYSGQPATADNARQYFYVPKGVRELQYYYAGFPHKVGPLGSRELVPVSVNFGFAKIKVPAGADGKVWVLSGRVQHLWFLNAPNLISPSPSALVLPRDLAVRDGLAVRE